MCSENSSLLQAISELLQRCGEVLLHGFEHASKVLRSDSVALIGWPRGVSFVLPWCSANPAILGGSSANRTPGITSLLPVIQPQSRIEPRRIAVPISQRFRSNRSLASTTSS